MRQAAVCHLWALGFILYFDRILNRAAGNGRFGYRGATNIFSPDSWQDLFTNPALYSNKPMNRKNIET